MTCNEYHDWVAADVDGIAGDDVERARAHAADCNACAAERSRQLGVRRLLRTRSLGPTAPAELRVRVLAALADASETLETPRWWRRRAVWAVAAGALAAAAIVLVIRGRDATFSPLIREYDRAARGALEVAYPTEAPSALEQFYRQHSGEGVPAHVLDLSSAGFRLVGGTFVDFPGRRARLSIYTDGADVIVCDYQFAVHFPLALPADGTPMFFRRGGASFCARRIGDEVCLLVTRMSLDRLRRKVGGEAASG